MAIQESNILKSLQNHQKTSKSFSYLTICTTELLPLHMDTLEKASDNTTSINTQVVVNNMKLKPKVYRYGQNTKVQNRRPRKE